MQVDANVKEVLSRTLCALGLYRTVRGLRDRYIRPDISHRASRLRCFYAQFLSPGELVFDIGANRGDRTEMFVRMGARVIAVEPIQSLAARLKRIYSYSLVKVEAVGVGSAPGELPLRVCSISEMSTFSDQFVEKQREAFAELSWDHVQTVPIVTLDSLIDKYGLPSFIKVDVEGFETEVLAGLHQPVRTLSFEVRPHDWLKTAQECLQHLAKLGTYEFNVSLEESRSFELSAWTDTKGILDALRCLLKWRLALRRRVRTALYGLDQ